METVLRLKRDLKLNKLTRAVDDALAKGTDRQDLTALLVGHVIRLTGGTGTEEEILAAALALYRARLAPAPEPPIPRWGGHTVTRE
jgi:hypothetical protein